MDSSSKPSHDNPFAASVGAQRERRANRDARRLRDSIAKQIREQAQELRNQHRADRQNEKAQRAERQAATRQVRAIQQHSNVSIQPQVQPLSHP